MANRTLHCCDYTLLGLYTVGSNTDVAAFVAVLRAATLAKCDQGTSSAAAVSRDHIASVSSSVCS